MGVFCQFTVHLTKNQLLRAYWRHNKTKRGIPILSRYTSLWQEYLACLNFQNAKQQYTLSSFSKCQTTEYHWLPASLRYIQRQQNQEGDLGLPRVSNQNSKLVLISKCQTAVYRNILPVYGTFDEKSAIEGILKAQQNQEGDTDTVTVYLSLARIPCLS